MLVFTEWVEGQRSYNYMNKIATTAATAVGIIILIVSGLSCSSQPAAKPAEKQIVTVQRGNLAVITAVDGSLVMPQAFDLRFGAPGNVREVPVQEGDFVKAGTILARLDDTPQQLDIKLANCALQQTLSNLYETVPGIQQTFMGYPSYYPNPTLLLSLEWSRDEVARAYDLFQRNQYGEAASELRIAVADLESSLKIFQNAMESTRSGLGSITPFAEQIDKVPAIQEEPVYGTFTELQKMADLIKQQKTDTERAQTLIARGGYTEAGSLLGALVSRLGEVHRTLSSEVNKIEIRYDNSYPDKDLCLYFYRAAEDKLNRALALVEKGKLDSSYNENLRTARHYMELCNSILGSSVLVLEHGLSLKNYQQYNVDLAKALVTLSNSKDNLLKTIIMAPFDGTVVKVDIKKNDVLSAIDYSAKGIQLVDTNSVKFQGQVDEIDILKIKVGQKATIAVDAMPGRTFPGTVSFISPSGSVGTGTVVKFSITIKLDPTDVALKGSLTSTAEIAVSSVENVLLVPVAAVTTTPAGSFVNVVTGTKGESEKRQVTLGIQNQQFAEVVSGLKEGEQVVIEAVTGAPIITRPTGPPPPPR